MVGGWCLSQLLLLFLVSLGSSICAAQCYATFEESGGLVVIEAESASPPTDGWVARTDIAGYMGPSFLEWAGQNYFFSPGNGLQEYTVKISTAGTYRFQWQTMDHGRQHQH